MNALSSSTASGRGHLWQAVLTGILLSLLGIVSFTAFGYHVSLQWLPLLAIVLWPRNVTPIFSVIAIFLLGLFQDWLGYGVPGQWAFIYLLLFLFIRPFERIKPLHFGNAAMLWFMSLLFSGVVFTLTGRLMYGVWPDFSRLLAPAFMATLLFPVFWFLRQNLQSLLSRREEAM